MFTLRLHQNYLRERKTNPNRSFSLTIVVFCNLPLILLSGTGLRTGRVRTITALLAMILPFVSHFCLTTLLQIFHRMCQ